MNYIFIKIYEYILLNKFFLFFKLKSNQKSFNSLRDFTKIKYEEENNNFYSRIILDPNFYDKKITDNKNKVDYTLNWLFLAKSRGGINLIKRTRNHIINWKKYFYNDIAAWKIEIIAQRLNSLISNYDFYGLNAEKKTKTIFQILILKNYLILSFLFKFQKNKNELNIKIIKTFLQLNFIFNIKNIPKILILINNQLSTQVNSDGFHRSMDPVTQAEFINCLYEINDMLLFFGLEKNKKIIETINEMQSVLQNMFHRDGSIPLFNGANNSYKNFLHKIVSLSGDIKNKKLSLVNNGLISLDIKKMKVFFDATKPDNKNINKNLHSGTLGFEMSYEDEKIITNCGSVKDSIKKKSNFS